MSDTQAAETPPSGSEAKPHVLIAGAGLSGLFLAILLEKIGYPYLIFERSTDLKRLGAVMSLNFNILPALEQAGLYEEIKKLALPAGPYTYYTGDLKELVRYEIDNEAIGYEFQIFPRPAFYDLLMSKIPKEKILLGKKVVAMEQDDNGATIICGDESRYHGDILVGADGAYSGVRQGLYKLMSDAKILPQEDAKDLNKGYICMVGTTDPLDPLQYPALQKTVSDMSLMIGKDNKYNWSIYTAEGNRICWIIIRQFATVKENDDEKFMNADWGPKANDAMIDEVKDFNTPHGKLGDLINKTPRDLISRVFLEDKLFETWHYNRTVLVGDACHKLLPSTGQGAVNALQDAVILANHIYECPSRDHKDIVAALQGYRDERYPHAKEEYEQSKSQAKIQYGQSLAERCMRYIVYNFIPKSMQMKFILKAARYRPIATFLPPPPVRGTVPALPQKASKKYAEELAKRGGAV